MVAGTEMPGSMMSMVRREFVMTSILQKMFEHNAWANLRLLDACAGLPAAQLDATVPGTYGRIRDTLVHIFGAEKSYLAALTGERPAHAFPPDGGFPGFDALRSAARASGEGLVAVAARPSEDQIIHGERRGEPFSIPASTFMTQAINHATEHRAEIKTILTQQDIEPPNLDGWTFNQHDTS